MANRFVEENDLKQIDLGDGDWVKIPEAISYGIIESLGTLDTKDPKQLTAFLSTLLKEWNLKDASDAVVPITEEAIKKLEFKTISQIMEEVNKQLVVPKAR
jgi:hypothetical protein|tara:strand:- start:131 stop:433 length:303 start_codon:yes stop_codon:yes gene_type:complete